MTQAKYNDVSVAVENYVAQVEIHRPPHNFFDVGLSGIWPTRSTPSTRTMDCRASVLWAEGSRFAPAPISPIARPRRRARPGQAGNPLYSEAVRFSVARNRCGGDPGPAIGGGFGLALVADFRVVSPEARFAANFVKIGFHPGFGLTHTLPRLIGAQKANLMFLTGRRITGEEAYQWGLADVVAEPEKLRKAAIEFAAEIAENAPLAVVSTRKTARRGLSEAVKAQTDIEFIEQDWLMGTEDHREGVKAVGERRPGNFTGK